MQPSEQVNATSLCGAHAADRRELHRFASVVDHLESALHEVTPGCPEVAPHVTAELDPTEDGDESEHTIQV